MFSVLLAACLASLAYGQYYCPSYGGQCRTSCSTYRTSSVVTLCPSGYRCCVQTSTTPINFCATRMRGTCKSMGQSCSGKKYTGSGFNICPSASQFCCVGGSGVVTQAPTNKPVQTDKPGVVTEPPKTSGTGCGTRKILGSQRVVGSSNARQGAWPWQAQMLKNGGHSCGGTLINDQWVLTAAHCFRSVTGSTRLSVALGEHYIGKRDDGNEQIIKVSKYILHKNFDKYNPSNNANDIALMKLEKKVKFNDHVNYACMPNPNENFDSNKDCYVTGWGLTKSNQNRLVLQETKGPMVPASQCRLRWGRKVTDKIVCHGNGQHGACKGDSGGPLVCLKNGKFTLVGVVSFGTNECTRYGFPTVYTRVAAYTDWILQNTRS